MKIANSKLTAKRKLFALEYLKDLNATQAAIRAGYSKHTARFQAARLLTNVNIQEEIQKAINRRAAKIEIDADKVLQAIAQQAFYDVRKFFDEKGNPREIHELDDQTADAVAGFEFVTLYDGSGDQKHAFGQLRKMKLADKAKNRELLGRHLGLFKDKLEVTTKDEFAGRSKEELRHYADHGEWPTPGSGDGTATEAVPSSKVTKGKGN